VSGVDRSQPLLEIDQLQVAFRQPEGVLPVVESVSFTIGQGERVALVGESGSGKSVTAYSILRLHAADQVVYPGGSIRFAGESLLDATESRIRAVRGREIAMIFQEPMSALNPLQRVGDQLIEPLLVHHGVDRASARRRMISLLARTGIDRPEQRFDHYPHMLSGGQRQRVMIAMALACRPRLLIADEPTTALDVTIQAQILDLLDELQREFNLAVLLITHDLNMVRRFADRICVMEQGRLVESAPTRQLFESPAHPYTRRLLASQPQRMVEPHAGSNDAGPLLSASHLQCRFPLRAGWLKRRVGEVRALDDVGVKIGRGETVGVVGESGSGKSTLGLCLLRLQECGGEIEFASHRLDRLGQRALRPLRRDIQVVFQDPFSSLSPRLTVESIIGEGLDLHERRLGKVERLSRIGRALEEVGLDESMIDRYPHEFSGGQRQRIAIARAVVLEPKLLILDEPTSALDVSVQRQVLELLCRLQRDHGMSYLFISHDLAVIHAMAHRTLVMQHGRVVEEGETTRLFANPEHPYTRQLLAAALGDTTGS
jgi:microcin C transport system ATP-binding protein